MFNSLKKIGEVHGLKTSRNRNGIQCSRHGATCHKILYSACPLKAKCKFIIKCAVAHTVKLAPIKIRDPNKNTDRCCPEFSKQMHIKKDTHEYGG